MASSPEVVYTGRAELAEGPVWHAGALWWVDIAVGTLNRWDPSTGMNISRATGGFLGAAAPCADGRWLLARQRDLALLDWETGVVAPYAVPSEPLSSRHRFNDGKCDPAGRFWVGTLSLDQKPKEGALFVVEAGGRIHSVLTELSLSNGLVWSPGHDRFYHIDTPTHRVSVFDYDRTAGTLTNRRTLIEFGEADGFPDGMTIDVAGNLWIALWSGRAVVRVEGTTGQVLERHPLPVSQVSSCAFGGPDLRTLYITTAWEGYTMAQRLAEPLAGSIFALRTDTSGLPATPFRLLPAVRPPIAT